MAATDNIAKCLGDAVDQGRISREGAERALREVKRVFDENPGVTEGAAAAAVADALKREAALKKRQTALQILATDRVLRDAAEHPGGAYRGTWAVFGRDLTGKATYSNVEGRQAAVRGILHAKFADGLDAYRSKNLGLTRDTIGLTRMVRDLYGEASGDPVAANAARAWSEATEYARTRFNAAGGNIPRKEAWRLPQSFDADAVKKMGRQAFEDWMHRAVDDGRLRIWDWEANAPVDPLRRAEIISNAYERISTNGVSDLVPGAGGRTKLANSRSERRAFEWTTADAWLEANRTFGRGDAGIFDTLVGHIDGMSQDIALLEILGPNPAATARVLIDTAKKAGATETEVYRLENLWGHVSGASLSPVRNWLATMAGGVRAWLSSAQLGSAVLSSVSDFQTMRQTAAWNGLGSNGIMGEYLRLLNPANAADRKLAVRAGLIADGWARRAMAAQRSMMEEIGQTLPARISDFVMRASGMNAHTQAAKWAFGMEFLGRLADDAARPFDALEPGLRGAMERYGIGSADWDLIRTKGVFTEDGVSLIFPEQMVRGGQPAAKPFDEARLRSRVAKAENDYVMTKEAAMEPSPYRRWDIIFKAIPEAIRDPFQAHGTSLNSAFSLLRDGIDKSREFHSGPLIGGHYGVDSTRTINPVIFLSDPGKSVKETGIRYAVLQGPAELIRDDLAAAFPAVRFMTLDEAARAVQDGRLPSLPPAAPDKASERAATRLLEMVDAERGFAVLEPGAAERALTLGRTQAGTAPGEFWRSTAQYKSFPITMGTRHLMRGWHAGDGAYVARAAGAYLARLTVGLTFFGAFAYQMKEIAKGKDPRDMTDWRFWAAAFFQGGGAGILGDFLNSAVTRSERSFYMTAIGGPTAGLVDDIMKLTGANIGATAEGKDANWGRDFASFVRRNTPGTSLWYSRLALDRLMWDQLQSLLDPDHHRSWARTEQRARQETRQEFWWRPGETAPERAPQMRLDAR